MSVVAVRAVAEAMLEERAGNAAEVAGRVEHARDLTTTRVAYTVVIISRNGPDRPERNHIKSNHSARSAAHSAWVISEGAKGHPLLKNRNTAAECD